jgi:hypothetical protein
MRTPPLIASYNHPHTRFEFNKMLALRVVKVHQLREIITETGRSLWCTPDHPVYVVGRGYVPANTIRPGSEVLAGSDNPTPMYTRQFTLPWLAAALKEPTQPNLPPPAPGQRPAPEINRLPTRQRDWVRANRAVRTDRHHTVYDFQVANVPNFVADGILVHNCLLLREHARLR